MNSSQTNHGLQLAHRDVRVTARGLRCKQRATPTSTARVLALAIIHRYERLQAFWPNADWVFRRLLSGSSVHVHRQQVHLVSHLSLTLLHWRRPKDQQVTANPIMPTVQTGQTPGLTKHVPNPRDTHLIAETAKRPNENTMPFPRLHLQVLVPRDQNPMAASPALMPSGSSQKSQQQQGMSRMRLSDHSRIEFFRVGTRPALAMSQFNAWRQVLPAKATNSNVSIVVRSAPPVTRVFQHPTTETAVQGSSSIKERGNSKAFVQGRASAPRLEIGATSLQEAFSRNELNRLTDKVIEAIDHRIIARRERFGRL